MNQFRALIWLKWTLFRNTMRSRKAVVNRVASLLGTLVALLFALLIAAALGFAAYGLTSFEVERSPRGVLLMAQAPQNAMFFVFMVLAFVYMMWAIIPLGLSGGSQFDAGRLLLYPVSLSKLFAMDWLSELTSLGSIFALPIILAVSLGAGLGSGNVAPALLAGLCAVLFGLALSKWLSTSLGALTQKRRTRGETLLALLGVVIGIGGAIMGQLAPAIAQRGTVFQGMRWTPPGAVAVALTSGLGAGGGRDYILAILTLIAYASLLIWITYWTARRAALGVGGVKRTKSRKPKTAPIESAQGWQLPLLSGELSAMIEKEVRYAMRNAQLRMLVLMPLILIGLRLAQQSNFGDRSITGGRSLSAEDVNRLSGSFTQYADGLLAAVGILYVFLILASLACNLFAYEAGGMRTFILSPLNRRTILLGKNITITLLAFVYSTLLIIVNQIVFRDSSPGALLFAALSFLLFSACVALVGNWLSIRFPRRLEFGKRMNASGVGGFLLILFVPALMIPPLLATVAGYLTRSLAVKYATLASFAGIAVALYYILINRQGRLLARCEIDILEAVSRRTDN
ncbi:MAG TPA: hypothetical protein VEQ40_01040 [Pyrinomonadaceae bacterium]|nr:hypothetical protein [Pyrinomonadaceae bacterium]